MKPKQSADFIAVLHYRTTEEGGRSTPAKSGYRPGIKFPFDEMQTSGQQIFLGKDYVNPGESIEAEITIVSTDYFANQLSEGMKFDFREGNTIIGTGEIKQILNPRLIKASR